MKPIHCTIHLNYPFGAPKKERRDKVKRYFAVPPAGVRSREGKAMGQAQAGELLQAIYLR
jgi:hypothetical protein